jgi:hypothetical protein
MSARQDVRSQLIPAFTPAQDRPPRLVTAYPDEEP